MSGIGSVGGIHMSYMNSATQSMRGQRPDPAQMASKLFEKLDTSGQGYLQKSDLESAFKNVGASPTGGSVDEMFSQLDGNSDGKVTKEEFSTTLKLVAEQLDQQVMSMRMQGGMRGGMPPAGMPPPPGGAGFTKDELTQQVSDLKSSSSQSGQQADSIGKLLQNFDQADTDGDGKVSFSEAMAYDQSSSTQSTEETGSTPRSSETSSTRLMQQVLQLMRAYDIGGDQQQAAGGFAVTA